MALMWEQYRKTFIPIQALIILVVLALVMFWKVPINGVVVFIVVMEACGLFGASWSARLKAKFLADKHLPPRKLQ
jgi:dolichyl-phosphate-mannose--protein O-mannosyl transferase